VRRVVAIVALAIAVVLGLAGCGDPDQKMLSEGARAARDAVSEISTARLAAQSLLEHELWSQPADQMVKDAEKSLGKVISTFEAQQPQTEASRKTYDQISTALSDAGDQLTQLRIALGNDDLSTARKQLAELDKAAQQLDQLGELAR
jgi:hypothetical protein